MKRMQMNNWLFLCVFVAVVEACVLHGLKRRIAGLLCTNKVAALFMKVSKSFSPAEELCRKVQELEQIIENRWNVTFCQGEFTLFFSYMSLSCSLHKFKDVALWHVPLFFIANRTIPLSIMTAVGNRSCPTSLPKRLKICGLEQLWWKSSWTK